MSEDEIAAEVKAVRAERRAREHAGQQAGNARPDGAA